MACGAKRTFTIMLTMSAAICTSSSALATKALVRGTKMTYRVKVGRQEKLKPGNGWSRSRRRVVGWTSRHVRSVLTMHGQRFSAYPAAVQPDPGFVAGTLYQKMGRSSSRGRIKIVTEEPVRDTTPRTSQLGETRFEMPFKVLMKGKLVGSGSVPLRARLYSHWGKAYIKTEVGKPTIAETFESRQ